MDQNLVANSVGPRRKLYIVLMLVGLMFVLGATGYFIHKKRVGADMLNDSKVRIVGTSISIQFLDSALISCVKTSSTCSASQSNRLTNIVSDAVKTAKSRSIPQQISSSFRSVTSSASLSGSFAVTYLDASGQFLARGTSAGNLTRTSSRSVGSCPSDSNTIGVTIDSITIPNAQTQSQLNTVAQQVIPLLKTYIGSPLLTHSVIIVQDTGSVNYSSYANYSDVITLSSQVINDKTLWKSALAFNLARTSLKVQYYYNLDDQTQTLVTSYGIPEAVSELIDQNGVAKMSGAAWFDQFLSYQIANIYLINSHAVYYEGQDLFLKMYLENKDVFKKITCAFASNANSSSTSIIKSAAAQAVPTIEGQSFNDWWNNHHFFNATLTSNKTYLGYDGTFLPYAVTLYNDSSSTLPNEPINVSLTISSGTTYNTICNTGSNLSRSNVYQLDILSCVDKIVTEHKISGGTWYKLSLTKAGANNSPLVQYGLLTAFGAGSAAQPHIPAQLYYGVITAPFPLPGGAFRVSSMEPGDSTSATETFSNGIGAASEEALPHDGVVKHWKIEYVCDAGPGSKSKYTAYKTLDWPANVLLPIPKLSSATTLGAMTFTDTSVNNKTITVSSTNPIDVVINIMSADGKQLIRKIAALAPVTSAVTTFTWDGKDTNNRQVAVGTYNLQLVGTDANCTLVGKSTTITVKNTSSSSRSSSSSSSTSSSGSATRRMK